MPVSPGMELRRSLRHAGARHDFLDFALREGVIFVIFVAIPVQILSSLIIEY